MTRTVVAFALFIEVGSAIVLARQAPAEASAFVNRLAQAMSRRDRAAVADMVRYPFSASVGGVGVPIANRGQLITLYDGLFTAELRCLVEESAAKGAGALRLGGGGITFAGGSIRADQVDGTLKITRLSVPPATGISAPAQPPPRRVTMRRGDVQYAGRLYGDGVDSYIVAARRGDVLQARIEQFAGRNAFVRVVEGKTGKPLDRAGSNAPRFTSVTIQEAGEYRVEVVRLAPYCLPSFTYLLTVTIK
ncbi:MAG TPA: hypothetical protein VFO21_07300 [Vicinamibacterales bacterium]|nr:hypothetical protein [Vicinamibacterales bacterium]